MEAIWARLPISCIGTVSANAVILLSLLMNYDNGSHRVIMRCSEMANLMAVSERYVQKLADELEETGYIIGRERLQSGLRITLKDDILPPKKHYSGAADIPLLPQNAQNRGQYRPQQRTSQTTGPRASGALMAQVAELYPEIIDLDD